MKCAECGKKTTWDESYGKIDYLVCPECFRKIRKVNNTGFIDTLQIIFEKSVDKS